MPYLKVARGFILRAAFAFALDFAELFGMAGSASELELEELELDDPEDDPEEEEELEAGSSCAASSGPSSPSMLS